MAPLLPSLAAHARNFLTSARTTTSELATRSTTDSISHLGPLAARAVLLARDDSDNTNKVDPSKGVIRPGDINNTFMFVLFGLIGVAFVCTGIWFFFWAKNGGFHFRNDDWDDYKSTVLRRKGPNGTLLSGATPSTRLGGGSVYKDIADECSTEYTGGLTHISGDTGDTGSTLTGITAGASDILGREKRKQKREKKEREREKKRDRKNRSESRHRTGRRVGEDGALVDEEAEAEAQSHLRAYRHEKAARVGGINKMSEGSEWDGSTNPENSTMASESLLSGQQSTPTKEDNKKDNKKKSGGIRKVYSTADRNTNRENERIRAEARRLADKGRAAVAGGGGSTYSGAGTHRRDFSFQRADARALERRGGQQSHQQQQQQPEMIEEEDITSTVLSGGSGAGADGRGRYLPPGSWAESDVGSGSEVGTKSYHHVIPGLSSTAGSSVAGSDYAEEKRRKRGGGGGKRYRRGEE
ncbi:hypothetical protein F4778DRAFT_775764 [Xylariomycetidae sp. FL2044]|nr:hypothetical protein F4778DRAFT_775764 [Xylariomycetidae sp. FL2044]